MTISQLNVQTGEIQMVEILPSEIPSPPTIEDRLIALQAVYDSERQKLNMDWLSATIADGAGEAARKAQIKIEMDALDAQYDIDFLTIIMGE